MVRHLPPLRAVLHFEAVANQGTLAAAAGLLGVSKGAVSQQLRQLEEFLGVALFDRSGRSLQLTDAGQRFFVATQSAFDGLESATARLSRQRQRRSLRLTVLPAFASLWLVQRLDQFQSRFPELDIEISSDASLVDFSRSDAHLGVRFGAGDAAGLISSELAVDELTPVCSPAYAKRLKLKQPSDVSRCRLLHDTYWHDDWMRWCEASGAEVPTGQEGQYFSLYSVAIDAAQAGGGIAMGHRLLIRDLVLGKQLVEPFRKTVPAREPYALVKPERSVEASFVTAFEEWISGAFNAR